MKTHFYAKLASVSLLFEFFTDMVGTERKGVDLKQRRTRKKCRKIGKILMKIDVLDCHSISKYTGLPSSHIC